VPFDIRVMPARVTQLATYSILPESLLALADVLVGRAEPVGQLPVAPSPVARLAVPVST
jgi:hypothetical protein